MALMIGRSTSVLFQSTPAIADGRSAWAENCITIDRQFQSTPAIADGRSDFRVNEQENIVVSIHARHC